MTVTGRIPVERTALGLRRDMVLARMQTDHDEAGHAVQDVRDCSVCLERYGLDGPASPRTAGAPRSWWQGREPDGDPDGEAPGLDDTELEELDGWQPRS